MDLQFHGANCISITHKGSRIVVDDNLLTLGGKSVTKAEDVALFTSLDHANVAARLIFDGPGEYEVSEISINGIAARANMDEPGKASLTMFKLIIGEINVLITGHVYPELSEGQLENVGLIDVLVVPVGGNGYTVDPVGALKLIKDIEPKIVVPTHYEDNALNFPMPQQSLENALKELAMEPKDRVSKLRLKPGDISDVTHLIILEKV